jgi:hypothetical protein
VANLVPGLPSTARRQIPGRGAAAPAADQADLKMQAAGGPFGRERGDPAGRIGLAGTPRPSWGATPGVPHRDPTVIECVVG